MDPSHIHPHPLHLKNLFLFFFCFRCLVLVFIYHPLIVSFPWLTYSQIDLSYSSFIDDIASAVASIFLFLILEIETRYSQRIGNRTLKLPVRVVYRIVRE